MPIKTQDCVGGNWPRNLLTLYIHIDTKNENFKD